MTSVQLLVASRATSRHAPSVVHKYRRQSRLQVSYLAVPESPWPHTCPHGLIRDFNCVSGCFICDTDHTIENCIHGQHSCSAAADNEVCDILGALDLPESEDSMDTTEFERHAQETRSLYHENSGALGPTPPPDDSRSDQQVLVGLTSPRGFVFRRT